MTEFKKLAAAVALTLIAALALALPSVASAEETVWICHPGQDDDLCAGPITGTTWHTPGPQVPLGYTRPDDPPVDCFYVYPTVSEQDTPNANLDKDPEVRRVVVQQARMFSRVCDIYAPMYRQETNPGEHSEYTDIAYGSVLSAWKDYLKNHNRGRGVILLGHSQGSATLGRLIDEEIDPNPSQRKRLVGAILPGANIHVPKGALVGGMFDHVPVCSSPGEYGCLVAYSMFNGYPGDGAWFANLITGYWTYPMDRPDPSKYEVVCADPTILSGDPGQLVPLVNFDYLVTAPEKETSSPWSAFPGLMTAECERQGNFHWLNADLGPEPDPFLVGLIDTVASGNDYHVPEVNLAEENLVRIADLQATAYVETQLKIAELRSRKRKLKKTRNLARQNVQRLNRKTTRLQKRVRKANRKQRRALKRTIKRTRQRSKAQRKRVRSLTRRLRAVEDQLGRLDA